MTFIETMNPDAPVLVCRHVIENPAMLTCVYHAGDGTVSLFCDDQHDLVHGTDVDWLHAGHILEAFPHLAGLGEVKAGCMGYYFIDHGRWRVEKMVAE